MVRESTHNLFSQNILRSIANHCQNTKACCCQGLASLIPTRLRFKLHDILLIVEKMEPSGFSVTKPYIPSDSPNICTYRSLNLGRTAGFTGRAAGSPEKISSSCVAACSAMLYRLSDVHPATWGVAMTLSICINR